MAVRGVGSSTRPDGGNGGMEVGSSWCSIGGGGGDAVGSSRGSNVGD